jgi:hypothetical protein
VWVYTLRVPAPSHNHCEKNISDYIMGLPLFTFCIIFFKLTSNVTAGNVASTVFALPITTSARSSAAHT